MLSKFFLDIVFNFLTGFLDLLPDISWSVDTSFFGYFTDVVRVAAYMLPLETVRALINLIISLTIFRIIISIPKAIWDLLPFV